MAYKHQGAVIETAETLVAPCNDSYLCRVGVSFRCAGKTMGASVPKAHQIIAASEPRAQRCHSFLCNLPPGGTCLRLFVNSLQSVSTSFPQERRNKSTVQWPSAQPRFKSWMTVGFECSCSQARN